MQGALTTPSKLPHKLRTLAALLVLAVCAPQLCLGAPHTQKHENRHEIDQLEIAWRDAILKSNTAALDALLSDDYMEITANGTLQSKEQTLANLRSGTTHITSITVSDRRVRFYGRTALVTSRALIAGSASGRDISGSYRYTRVYVRDAQGVWKIVSFETSRIRETGGHK